MIIIRNPYIDHDKNGHCVACHDDVVERKVVDGKEIKRALANIDEIMFLLNDNSKIRATICRSCKSTIEPSDFKQIMDSIYKGWVEELKKSTLDNVYKESFLEGYKTKEIIRIA